MLPPDTLRCSHQARRTPPPRIPSARRSRSGTVTKQSCCSNSFAEGTASPAGGAVDTALSDGAIQQSCRERLGLALGPLGDFCTSPQCLGVSHYGPFPHHSSSKEKILYSCHYVPFRMYHRFNTPQKIGTSQHKQAVLLGNHETFSSRRQLYPNMKAQGTVITNIQRPMQFHLSFA